MSNHASLIIRCPTPIHPTVSNLSFEWFRFPKLIGSRRLNVVMRVKQNSRPGVSSFSCCNNSWGTHWPLWCWRSQNLNSFKDFRFAEQSRNCIGASVKLTGIECLPSNSGDTDQTREIFKRFSKDTFGIFLNGFDVSVANRRWGDCHKGNLKGITRRIEI